MSAGTSPLQSSLMRGRFCPISVVPEWRSHNLLIRPTLFYLLPHLRLYFSRYLYRELWSTGLWFVLKSLSCSYFTMFVLCFVLHISPFSPFLARVSCIFLGCVYLVAAGGFVADQLKQCATYSISCNVRRLPSRWVREFEVHRCYLVMGPCLWRSSRFVLYRYLTAIYAIPGKKCGKWLLT